MEEKNELIVIKQLPVIEERLKELSQVIDERVSSALALECTEENYKDVKKARTELKKQFDDLETKRKEVKSAVLTPYNNFEDIYKKYVSEKFKAADLELKRKIDTVETGLKSEKEEEIKRYFEELKESKMIDFVEYERMNLKVGLSDSNKSLKEQVKIFIEKIESELKTIETQENKDEILVEYIKSLDLNNAIQVVSERKKQLEQLKEQKAAKEEQKITDEQVIAKIDSLTAPKVEEIVVQEELLELSFKVRGTKDELIKVINYLENEGLDYEQC